MVAILKLTRIRPYIRLFTNTVMEYFGPAVAAGMWRREKCYGRNVFFSEDLLKSRTDQF